MKQSICEWLAAWKSRHLKNEIKVFNWVETGLGTPFQTMLLMGTDQWPELTPEQAKAALDAMPEGRRAIFWWHGLDSLYNQDTITGSNGIHYRSLWPVKGIAYWKNQVNTWFKALHDIGGKVDVVYFDYEDGISTWSQPRAGDPLTEAEYIIYYQAIMADPRWPELATRMGFSDLINPEVWNFWVNQNYVIFNGITSALRSMQMNEAIYEPLKSYWPNIIQWCDGAIVTKPSECVREFNGHRSWSWYGYDDHLFPDGGTGYATHDVIYLFNGYGLNFANRTDVVGDGQPVGSSPYKAVLFFMDEARAQMRSTSRPWVPLMAYEHFSDNFVNDLTQPNFHGTGWYQEVVFHALLTGADTIEYWNPAVGAAQLFPPTPDDPMYEVFMADARKLHGIVVEAQSHIPYKGICLTKERVNYRSTEFTTSFKMVNGQTISRVTYSEPRDGKFGEWVVS